MKCPPLGKRRDKREISQNGKVIQATEKDYAFVPDEKVKDTDLNTKMLKKVLNKKSMSLISEEWETIHFV